MGSYVGRTGVSSLTVAGSIRSIGLVALGICLSDPQGGSNTFLVDGEESPSPHTDPNLRAAFIAARQSQGQSDPSYAFGIQVDGHASASQSGRYRADLGPAGISWMPEDERWRASLSTVRYGCSGALAPVEHVAKVHIEQEANRATLDERAGNGILKEWVVHGPLGIEQGWTLEEIPCSGELILEVGVTGLDPLDLPGAQGVDLQDAAGVTRLHYSDLAARGADGNSLESRMSVVHHSIMLHVDARAARFPVIVDPLVWTSAQVLSGTHTGSNAGFGTSIAISGNTAIIGAPTATVGTLVQGAAFVFTLSNGSWTEQPPVELTAYDSIANAQFGSSVAVSSGTILVGSPSTTVGFVKGQGAVYVYTLSNGSWTAREPKIAASDGANGDSFGSSLAVSSGTLIVGAPGANKGAGSAYIFAQSGNTWSQQQKLVPDDPISSGAFGTSVAVSGNTIIVGSPNATGGSPSADCGGAYVFVQPIGSATNPWSQQAKLSPPDADISSLPASGSSVGISGNTVFVGATWPRVGTGTGTVYVYTHTGASWSDPTSLIPSNAAVGDSFGSALGTSATRLIAGDSNSPQAYVFGLAGGAWIEEMEIPIPSAASGTGFGAAVAIDSVSNNIAIGAPTANVGALVAAGDVYIGPIAGTDGTACSANSDCENSHCLNEVCCAAAACTGSCASCATGTCGPVSAHTAGNPPCGAYLCSGSGTDCPSSCGTDADCATGYYCASDAACRVQHSLGSACNIAAGAFGGDCFADGCLECSSGHCVDGVCCSEPSCGLCQVCALALQAPGGTNGTCSTAQVSTNPHGNCGAGLTCNGSGICSPPVGDAATDATSLDAAGVRDAGAIDSSRGDATLPTDADAPMLDASEASSDATLHPLDATVNDATTADAPTGDTALTDAAASEAAVIDATSTDAEVIDSTAAATDAGPTEADDIQISSDTTDASAPDGTSSDSDEGSSEGDASAGPTSKDSGCSCRATGDRAAAPWPALAAIFALAIVMARRRRAGIR